MTGQGMREGDPLRHSGARWCDDHDRWECSKPSKRSKRECHGIAISGMPTCRMHAGIASELAKAKGEAKKAAWSLVDAADLGPIDPGSAMLQLIQQTWQRLGVLGELLRVQVEDQDYEGLVGPTYARGADGQRVVTGERVRGLARYEAEERDRLARFLKAAHDMGIAERHVELEQARAEQVVAAVRVGLDALQLIPADRDAFLRAFLTALGRGPEMVAGAIA